MNTLPIEKCSHSELLELDATTSFTAASNAVIQHVLATPEIATAVRLWLYIRFEQSGFSDRAYLKRTVGFIANTLSVSRATIQKWQRLLIKEGYLDVTYSKREDGQNAPNGYRACLPKHVFKQIIQNDKLKRRTKTSGDRPPKNKDPQRQEAQAHVRPTQPEQTQNPHAEPMLKECVYTLYTCLNNRKFFDSLSSTAIPEWVKHGLCAAKVRVNLNGKTVLIDTCNQYLADYISTSNVIKTTLEQLLSTRELRVIAQVEQRTATQRTRTASPQEMLKKKAKIPAALHIKAALREKLVKVKGIDTGNLHRLQKEILYSVTYGSLQSCTNGMHAINTAIKLVREGRWTTPTGFNGMGPQH